MRPWAAGRGQPERQVETFLGSGSSLSHDTLRQGARRLNVGHIIHQGQCLQRCVGSRLAHGAHFAQGRVKRHHRRRGHGSFPESIQTAPVQVLIPVLNVVIRPAQVFPQPFRLIGLNRRAANFLRQQPADCQGLVTNHFSRQAHPRSSCQQAILRILLKQFRSYSGRLPIGCAHDNHLLQRVDVPAGADELGGQPVEQLRMSRPFSLEAKVIDRLDEACPKVHLPIPVDGHACCQWVRWIDQPAGESQPVVWNIGGQRRETGWDARSRFFAAFVIGASNQNESITRRLHLFHHHGGGKAFYQLLSLFTQSFELLSGLLDGFGRVLLHKIGSDLVGLRLGPSFRRNCGDIRNRIAGSDHFDCLSRQSRVVYAYVVDVAVETAFRAATATDSEGFRRLECLVQFVKQHLELLRFPVDINLDSASVP